MEKEERDFAVSSLDRLHRIALATEEIVKAQSFILRELALMRQALGDVTAARQPVTPAKGARVGK